MTPEEVLLQLFRNGIALSVEGGRLRYEAFQPISEVLLAEMKANKDGILDILRSFQHLGGKIGEMVLCPDGREGILWGISPYGASVLFQEAVLLYSPIEIYALNCVSASKSMA